MRCSRALRFATVICLLPVTGFGCRPVTQRPQTRAARPIARVLAFSPGRLPASVPEADSTRLPPDPTAEYPSLGAACDAVQEVIAGRLGVRVERADSVSYENEFIDARRTGCALRALGHFSSRPDTVGSVSVDGDVAAGLTAAGWIAMTHYSADGPDGSAFAMRSRETVCLFRASWDGGDDSDTTYVPSDEWELVGHCAPREPTDSV
jgi:hypothetical protein